jgi:hypothetical protein
MSNHGMARVHYFERQFLRTQDFTDEQAYHLTMRRRHNIAHHTWGIVHGLGIVVDKEGGLFVQAGMAIDGYGRELIIPEQQSLSTGAFVEKGSDVLEVWLVYDRVGSDRVPKGYAGCGDDADPPFYRWQERPLIRLDVPDPAFTDRRRPKSVPEGDWTFAPSRALPDDPEQDWPVFLGQVRYNPDNPDQPYSVDPADRPYVGLVGEVVAAPSGRARVEIGAESDGDTHRFAAFISGTDPMADIQPRLEIDNTGRVSIRGDTTVHGNVIMAGRAIEFRAGSVRSPEAPPWHIYHLENTANGEHELRIEMARPVTGGTPGLNQVVIGSWSPEEKQFHPCLTIADDCTVTVHGNLVVEGQIREGDRVAAQLSQEARRFLLSGYLTGVGGANVLLENVSRPPVGVEPGTVVRAAVRLAPEAAMRALVESLEADAEQLAAFGRLVRERTGLADRLRQALRRR